MLLFRAKTSARGWRSIELARLKKEERRRRKKNNLAVLLLFGWVLSRCFLAPLGVLLVMKTLEDEQYVVLKAYKLAVLEILRNLFVLAYIACPRYPYIRVYRLYDSARRSRAIFVSRPRPSVIFHVVHERKRYFNWFIATYTEQYFRYYIFQGKI